MENTKIALLVICWISAACTSSEPTYPNAGLRIYSEGAEITNHRLLQQSSHTCITPGRLEFVQPSRKVALVGPDLHFSIEWDAVYRITGDQYDFMITVNNASSKRRLVFRGKPIVLIEDPYRVVIDNVCSNK